MRSDFELAEILWEAADPCLSRDDRDALSCALHVCDPFLAVFGVVRALIREDYGLPCNIFDELRAWLASQPTFNADDPLMAMRLELHVIASEIRATPEVVSPVGGYGDATLCYFILDDADVVDAEHEQQASVLRRWLASHRPSPALRADIWSTGFGYLLEDLRRNCM